MVVIHVRAAEVREGQFLLNVKLRHLTLRVSLQQEVAEEMTTQEAQEQ